MAVEGPSLFSSHGDQFSSCGEPSWRSTEVRRSLVLGNQLKELATLLAEGLNAAAGDLDLALHKHNSI